VAYGRLEERRTAFQKQVKEQSMFIIYYAKLVFIESWLHIFQATKMREIISTLPADVDTLIAKLEREFEDLGKDEGSGERTKKRERTVEGALAGLQL
jgi:hypothetical protein